MFVEHEQCIFRWHFWRCSTSFLVWRNIDWLEWIWTIAHRIHGAAIYGNLYHILPSIYPIHVSIYTSTMDPIFVGCPIPKEHHHFAIFFPRARSANSQKSHRRKNPGLAPCAVLGLLTLSIRPWVPRHAGHAVPPSRSIHVPSGYVT